MVWLSGHTYSVILLLFIRSSGFGLMGSTLWFPSITVFMEDKFTRIWTYFISSLPRNTSYCYFKTFCSVVSNADIWLADYANKSERTSEYSGGLNTEHWNTIHFEVQIFNGLVLEWGMVSHSDTFGSNHSKTKLLEIQAKWLPFWFDFQWFWTNWPPLENRMQGYHLNTLRYSIPNFTKHFCPQFRTGHEYRTSLLFLYTFRILIIIVSFFCFIHFVTCRPLI